ncbi:MAG: thioredoxin [Candidatus Lokiarchaeota archaeon]|nr:thioredoxin [Candidatus Lokiarchaeota archaeon]
MIKLIPIVNLQQMKQIIQNQKLVMVTFITDTCSACRMQFKVLDQIEPLYHGRAQFLKLNIQDNPQFATEKMLFSVPTTMFFMNGKIVRFKSRNGTGKTDRLMGYRDAATLQGILNFLLQKA